MFLRRQSFVGPMFSKKVALTELALELNISLGERIAIAVEFLKSHQEYDSHWSHLGFKSGLHPSRNV